MIPTRVELGKGSPTYKHGPTGLIKASMCDVGMVHFTSSAVSFRRHASTAVKAILVLLPVNPPLHVTERKPESGVCMPVAEKEQKANLLASTLETRMSRRYT